MASQCTGCQGDLVWIQQTTTSMRDYGSYDWIAPPPEVIASVKRQFREIGRTPPQPSRLNQWLASVFAPKPALAISGVVALLAILVLGYTLVTLLAERPSLAATLSDISGNVHVQSSGDRGWQAIANGHVMRAGDRIRSDGDGGGLLLFPDGSWARLSPNAQLSILQLMAPESGEGQITVLHQYFGKTEYDIEPQDADGSWFEIETSSASITVKGTAFAVEITERLATLVTVTEGAVEVRGEGSAVEVIQGQSAFVLPLAEPQIGMPTPELAPPCPLATKESGSAICPNVEEQTERSPGSTLENPDLDASKSAYGETIYLPGINTRPEPPLADDGASPAGQE